LAPGFLLADPHEQPNIVITGKRADADTLRVPQEPAAIRESVATRMNGTRWDRYFRKTRPLARTSEPACRILRMVSRLFGNPDAALSAAAVGTGTTRKVGAQQA